MWIMQNCKCFIDNFCDDYKTTAHACLSCGLISTVVKTFHKLHNKTDNSAHDN